MSALRGWQAVPARLTDGQRLDVREILAGNYAAEVRHARQLAEPANALGRDPDRRKRLLEIAARDGEHARWLHEAIERVGGGFPSISDLREEKEAAERFLRDAYLVEREHPDIARLLERISEEEAAHQCELVWLLARITDRVALDRAP